MLQFKHHASQRLAQRYLSAEAVNYVMTYGQRFHCAGALICFLRRRDVPAWDRADAGWMRLAGTAVILTKDGRTVVTVWRNGRHGLKRIRHKPKYAVTPEAETLPWAA